MQLLSFEWLDVTVPLGIRQLNASLQTKFGIDQHFMTQELSSLARVWPIHAIVTHAFHAWFCEWRLSEVSKSVALSAYLSK